ncbi:hypothetical protein Tsubulata_019219 [Turnera subulata]|uniref:RING-CH-type domain-containing protein n=1 Tax=Turnera subulata TaxID=218843 RepID=A0A9Q0IZS8_9ROSI|nr:hypothetical protein Tsubulata_019219 [Turnera subulata]
MEQDKRGTDENLGQVNPGRSSGSNGNSTNLDDGVLPDSGIVLHSGKKVSSGGDSAVLDVNNDRLRSSKRVVNQDGQQVCEPSNEGTSGTSGSAANEVVIVINSGEIVGDNQETKNVGVNIQGLRSNGGVRDQEMQDSEVLDQVAISINSQENVDMIGGNGQLEVKNKELETVNQSKTKVSKEEKPSSVVDVKCGGGTGFKDDWDGEKVCRICHLSSDALHDSGSADKNESSATMDLIQLGCGCKDELGIAHASCAEAWFKLKGNRICEICGMTADNITYIGDNRFFERRFINIGNGGNGPSDGGTGCWGGQPFCNLLMALLVIAFVLPWFFRVNMF